MGPNITVWGAPLLAAQMAQEHGASAPLVRCVAPAARVGVPLAVQLCSGAVQPLWEPAYGRVCLTPQKLAVLAEVCWPLVAPQRT